MLTQDTIAKGTTAPPRREIIFSNGSDHFESLLVDIAEAETSIDLETYIFQNDAIGKRVATALINAAKHGVTVRVLVDGAGTPRWRGSLPNALEKAGVTTKVFHPFPWALWNWSRSIIKLSFLAKWVYLLLNMNSRDHRKVCIIDNKIAYIGSLNITHEHLRSDQGGDGWRDNSVRLEGVDLSDLKKAFHAAWTLRTIQERLRDAFRQVRRDPPIRLNYTRHRRRLLYKQLLRKMAHCKTRIWITNAYFVPDNFLLKHLTDAAQSGIDVRILLPSKSDILLAPWASSVFYYNLLKTGVRIFEYLPSVLHAKSLILDDWMLIGSSNLNNRSLLHDLEADVNISTPDAKKQLENLFLNDLAQSRELSLDSWEQWRPRIQRIIGRLLLYMKYWM